jgi:hypothetical protein
VILAVKARVDRDPSPGQFILTGSSRFLTFPRTSESLAGRVEIIDLWPLSQGEIHGTQERFVDRFLTYPEATRSAARVTPSVPRDHYWSSICAGGFPAILEAPRSSRSRWLGAYARTLTEREVLDVSRVRHPGQLPRLLRLVASSTARELNVNAVANDLQLPWATIDCYLTMLETLFVRHGLPPWSRDLTARVIRHRKAHMVDNGLAAFLLGVDERELADPLSKNVGQLTETFVVGEIARQITWSEERPILHHYRDKAREVDLVLETADGRVAAIEVRAGTSVSGADLRALEYLRDRIGERFVQGAILNTGAHVLSFGDRLSALPIASLWGE